jgi:hypothetical protein
LTGLRVNAFYASEITKGYMRKITISALTIGILIVIVMIYLLYSQRNAVNNSQLQYVDFPATPIVNSETNNKFINRVLSGQTEKTNNGLTVERLKVIALEGVPPPSVNHVSLLILNHTEEPIEFENQGFGVQVFEYDASTSQWNEVILPYKPERKKKIVPAKLEDFDFEILNNWELTGEDFTNSKTGKVRILISGRGLDTGKKYYAFTDITLQK